MTKRLTSVQLIDDERLIERVLDDDLFLRLVATVLINDHLLTPIAVVYYHLLTTHFVVNMISAKLCACTTCVKQ